MMSKTATLRRELVEVHVSRAALFGYVNYWHPPVNYCMYRCCIELCKPRRTDNATETQLYHSCYEEGIARARQRPGFGC